MIGVRAGLTLALALAGCAATGQEDVTVPLFVGGTAIEAPIEGRDAASIVLQRAELAFGPLYLCAGTQAGDLCETARLEWLDAVVVDALDPEAHEIGELDGISGPVRSWMYDLGFASLLTEPEPLALPATDALGRASVRIEGIATVGAIALPFSASVRVRAEEETEAGVPIVRKSTGDAFEHDVQPGDPGLLVRFDPAAWVADIDFATLVSNEGCEPGGPIVACAGTVESQCDADGDVLVERDCASGGEICVSGLGCSASLEITDGAPAAFSIRNQLVAGARPIFEWRQSP